MRLSDNQKLEILGLYFNGKKKYTDISEALGLPYKSVNIFLTKWKTERGLINKRKPRKKQVKEVPAQVLPIFKDTPNISVTIDELQELRLLREFYKKLKSKRGDNQVG